MVCAKPSIQLHVYNVARQLYLSQNDPLYLYAPQYLNELIKPCAKDSVFSDAINDLRGSTNLEVDT